MFREESFRFFEGISLLEKQPVDLIKSELDLNTLVCLDVCRKRGRSTILTAPTMASKTSKGNDRMCNMMDEGLKRVQ
jgi:hypothetical protein